MTEEYLQSVGDGLPLRDAGEWTKDKLYYLDRYLDIFTTGMHKQSVRGFNYIDLFAGPGKSKIPETNEIILGSPILALQQKHSFTGYHLVEWNSSYHQALITRASSSPQFNRIRFYEGDANEEVVKIVALIKADDDEFIPDTKSSLNLAFIDPEGIDATWETVESLTELYSMDLIIHYPVMALNRNMRKEYNKETETSVDRFFGDTEWRNIYEPFGIKGTHGQAHPELISHYRGKLQDKGYQEVKVGGQEPLMRTETTKAPLYRLIFASKHPRGHDFWEKISEKEPNGQLSLW